eukprot:7407062-Pyramimonas_sp.AAC.2
MTTVSRAAEATDRVFSGGAPSVARSPGAPEGAALATRHPHFQPIAQKWFLRRVSTPQGDPCNTAVRI